MSIRHIDELAIAEQRGVRRVTSRLIDEYASACSQGAIEQLVSEFLDETIPTAKVTRFLPILAERSVRDRIRARPVGARCCPMASPATNRAGGPTPSINESVSSPGRVLR